MTEIKDGYREKENINFSRELKEEKDKDNRILNCSNGFFRDLIEYLEMEKSKD